MNTIPHWIPQLCQDVLSRICDALRELAVGLDEKTLELDGRSEKRLHAILHELAEAEDPRGVLCTPARHGRKVCLGWRVAGREAGRLEVGLGSVMGWEWVKGNCGEPDESDEPAALERKEINFSF